MEEPVRVVCQQLNPDVERPDDNVASATEAIVEALELGADLVVLPELVTSGYVFRSEAEAMRAAHSSSAQIFAAWGGLLAATDAVLAAGFAEIGLDGSLYNSAVLVTGEGVGAVYRKLHLWDEEKRWFLPGGQRPPVTQTRVGRVGLSICYDIEFPETIRGLALRGADLVVVPTNWPRSDKPDGERPPEMIDAASAARLNGVAVVCCDRAGSERGVSWTGGSCIIGADGWLVAERPDRDVGPVVGTIYPHRSRDKTRTSRNDIMGDRRPEFYADLVAPTHAQLDSSAR